MGARRRAREHALQVLYALDVNADASVDGALAAFWANFEPEDAPAVIAFTEALVRGARAHLAEIDAAIGRASKNWRLERMARVDRNLLRLGTFELRFAPEVPTKVVINEAIEVAKRYGTAESPAFINGLLDRVAQESPRE